MELKYEFKKYTLVITNVQYGGSNLHQHEIELYKNGSLERAMLTIVNKSKYFDPYLIYECSELYGWSKIDFEEWEEAIEKLHQDYKKIKSKK